MNSTDLLRGTIQSLSGETRTEDESAGNRPFGTGTVAQVDTSHYKPSAYDTKQRYFSYVEQLWETLALSPRDAVEVGVGGGFLSRALREFDVTLTTVDFDETLNPDIVADVTSLPLPDGFADACLCFEVLEHLPFDRFDNAIRELLRVSRRWVFLSVPDIRSTLSVHVSRGYNPIKTRRFVFNGNPLRKPAEHTFDGEHYWEIGKDGTSEAEVISRINALEARLVKHYRLPANPFHHFFLLEKYR